MSRSARLSCLPRWAAVDIHKQVQRLTVQSQSPLSQHPRYTTPHEQGPQVMFLAPADAHGALRMPSSCGRSRQHEITEATALTPRHTRSRCPHCPNCPPAIPAAAAPTAPGYYTSPACSLLLPRLLLPTCCPAARTALLPACSCSVAQGGRQSGSAARHLLQPICLAAVVQQAAEHMGGRGPALACMAGQRCAGHERCWCVSSGRTSPTAGSSAGVRAAVLATHSIA